MHTSEWLKQPKNMFFSIFILLFFLQLVLKGQSSFEDKGMWADQIQYFLEGDPRMLDVRRAYGYPGSTVVGLGSLFHLLFGLSYVDALSMSMSILSAATTAACAVICSLLYKEPYWWITTTVTLTFSRLTLYTVPATAIVIPFITLMVLVSWLLCEQESKKSRIRFFAWGCVTGLAATTRLDIALLVSVPLFMLLALNNGYKIILPVLAGTITSMFFTNPFLWFMPVQHLSDLLHKFTTISSAHSTPLGAVDFLSESPLAVLSLTLSLVGLITCRRGLVIPVQMAGAITGITLIALLAISKSTFQLIRYLYPIIIVWEVFLPLFIYGMLQVVNEQRLHFRLNSATATSLLVGFIMVAQFALHILNP